MNQRSELLHRSEVVYFANRKRPGRALQFHAFDADYVERLRSGDPRTQLHFVGYFTELLQLKLRSRLSSPQAIEDVRQETFVRVLNSLGQPHGLQSPEKLGAFVNAVCNNVLLEHYRTSGRSESLDAVDAPALPPSPTDVLGAVADKQQQDRVREILAHLPQRDRALLRAVFWEDRDRDEVCHAFGVDRQYLRVLLFRAKQDFKSAYVKRIGGEEHHG